MRIAVMSDSEVDAATNCGVSAQSRQATPFASRLRAERLAEEKHAEMLVDAIGATRAAARHVRAMRRTVEAYPAEVRRDVIDRIDAMLSVLASFDSVLRGEEDSDDD